MSSKAGGPNKVILISLVAFLVLLLISTGVILFLRSQPQPPAANKCSVDTDCSSGQKCVSSVCKQCEVNDDCPTGQTCVSGTCKTPSGTTSCTVSTDCKTTSLPKCIIPTGSTTGTCKQCGADADCTVGDKTRCRLNSCVAPIAPGKCYYNEDCASVAGKTKCLLPSGATLGTTLGTCSACNANNNCSSGNVCYQGNCTLISAVPPTPCTKPADCTSDPTGKTNCLIPTNSLTGLCSTCAVNSHCPTEKPICGSGTCYGCVFDTDCTNGQLCQNGGTADAKCVDKACSVDSECSSVVPGSVCAYKGTAFASCAIPCTSNTTCTSGDNPNAQTPNCWGYENGNVTQYKFKAGSSYCVPNGPQKCCSNRFIQSCTATSGNCDSGQTCVNKGDPITGFGGKALCNTCESQGKTLDPSKTLCIDDELNFYPNFGPCGSGTNVDYLKNFALQSGHNGYGSAGWNGAATCKGADGLKTFIHGNDASSCPTGSTRVGWMPTFVGMNNWSGVNGATMCSYWGNRPSGVKNYMIKNAGASCPAGATKIGSIANEWFDQGTGGVTFCEAP